MNTINDLTSYRDIRTLTMAEYGVAEGDVMAENGVEFFLVEEDLGEGRVQQRRIDIPRPAPLRVMDKVRTPRGWVGTITQWVDGLAKVMSQNVLGEWTSCLFDPDDLAKV